MIAYNHYIKFIPELKNDKKVVESFFDVVTVQESPYSKLDQKLPYVLTFFNNQGRDLSLYTDRAFACTVKGQIWVFEVKSVVTFFWHSGTLHLEYIKHEKFTELLLEYWSLHTFLPLFFTIEKIYNFLHAGAVEVDGNPILFIADSCGGKSTITDFFMKKGHIMISDDKVGIFKEEDLFLNVPSHPHHRPYRDMEDLGYFVNKFSINVKPIKNIYLLERTREDADIKIIELKGVEKFEIIRKSYDIELSFMKNELFPFTSKLTNQIKLYKIYLPWKKDRLSEVYNKIIKHTKNNGD